MSDPNTPYAPWNRPSCLVRVASGGQSREQPWLRGSAFTLQIALLRDWSTRIAQELCARIRSLVTSSKSFHSNGATRAHLAAIDGITHSKKDLVTNTSPQLFLKTATNAKIKWNTDIDAFALMYVRLLNIMPLWYERVSLRFRVLTCFLLTIFWTLVSSKSKKVARRFVYKWLPEQKKFIPSSISCQKSGNWTLFSLFWGRRTGFTIYYFYLKMP